MQRYTIEGSYQIQEILIKESFGIPAGFIEEVWYDKETKELTFSGPMTSNSWNESEDKNDVCLGTIEAASFSDIECFKDIDGDFVEVDDGENELARGWKTKIKKGEYERYYNNSSILTYDDAMDRVLQVASDGDWYSDIIEEYDKAVGNTQEIEAQ